MPTGAHMHCSQITKEGVSLSEPFALETRWDYSKFSQPTQWAVGAW